MSSTPLLAGRVATDRLDARANKAHDHILTVFATANFTYLQEVALPARKAQDKSLDREIACSIDAKFVTHETNNLKLRVAFSDNVD
ncbi:hypothetical protein MAJ_03292, partial [Metarhizium majus ARSEF 297]